MNEEVWRKIKDGARAHRRNKKLYLVAVIGSTVAFFLSLLSGELRTSLVAIFGAVMVTILYVRNEFFAIIQEMREEAFSKEKE